MTHLFKRDERLGIPVPKLNLNWEQYSYEQQQAILLQWEKIRGSIPDRIAEIETIIGQKQTKLELEENFAYACQLNHEIAGHASVINDLWLWYRTTESVTAKPHQ